MVPAARTEPGGPERIRAMERKYAFLLGLVVTLPLCALALLVVVRYWQIALIGMALVAAVVITLVAALIFALPVVYVVVAVYHVLQPRPPLQSTHYTLDQGKEAGLREERGVRPGNTDDGQEK